MKGCLWGSAKIIVVTIGIVGMALQGELSPIVAALFIVLYALLVGAVQGSGDITKTLFWFLEIAFYVMLGLILYARTGNVVAAVLVAISAFIETVDWFVKLMIEGHISVVQGVIAIVGILFLTYVGCFLGVRWRDLEKHPPTRTARITWLIFFPIAVIIVFVAHYGGDSMWGLLGQFLLLLLLLLGFYILAFGWSSSRRK